MTTTTKDDITENSIGTDHPVTSTAARRALAICRILLGAVFLWPALDKTFGLGYATPAEKAWITGNSPASGYLSHLDTPPAAFFAALAGPVTDVLFIAGMAGTGLALLLGVGLRVAAVSGGLIMAMLWVAAWPFAAGSNNPLVDDHLVYVALLAALALTRAGDTWGLGGVLARSGLPGATTVLR